MSAPNQSFTSKTLQSESDACSPIQVLLFHMPPTGRDAFPISLGYIAASLRACGVSTYMVDLTTGSPYTPQQIQDVISSHSPRFVGFSGYQANIDPILELARFAKEVDPRIVTLMGGPQAAFMPSKALSQMPSMDILCRGEGETVAPRIVEAVLKRIPLASVKGIVFRSAGEIVETPPAPLTSQLDRFPSPYQNRVFDFTQGTKAAMLTSRGCPYNCRFCHTPKFYQKGIHYHSPERVLEDISVCLGEGIREMIFYDPAFTVDGERVKAIMQGILDKGWEISMWCETRADLVDRRMLSFMAKAGMKKIAYGLETIHSPSLDAVNKRLDLVRFEKTIKETQDAGIGVEIYTLFALPMQTFDAAMQTIEYVKELGVRLIGNSSGQQLSMFFGTDITARPEAFGIRVRDGVRPLYRSPGTEFETDHMTAEEIARIGDILRDEGLQALVSMQALSPFFI